jgi:curved DNA-binding protein CbpA/uncharacterized RDD family membrane protein YckC
LSGRPDGVGSDRTHYTTLGVTPDAPQQVVRAAYVALSKLHHPDSGSAPDERRMQEINSAWQVLRDPTRRAVYDATLAATPPPPRPRPQRRPRPDRDATAPGRRGWGEADTDPGDRTQAASARARARDATRTEHRDDQGPPTRRRPAREDNGARPGRSRRRSDHTPGPGGSGWGDEDDPVTPPRGEARLGWGEVVDDPDVAEDVDDVDVDGDVGEWDGRDPTAVTARRIVAFALDLAAVAVLAYACWYVVVLALYDSVERSDAAGAADVCRYVDSTTANCHVFGSTAYFHRQYWPVALAVAIPLVVIHVIVQGRTGATPGKALMGLRTVREDGTEPGYLRALVRTGFLVFVDLAFWCVPIVGISQIRTTVGHRRLGDKAARTYVVTRRAAHRPVVVPPSPPPD